MSSPSPPSPTPQQGVSVSVALWVAAGVLFALVFLFPYAFGHGFARQSLGYVTYTIATAMEDWEHCVFVPFIAGALVYLRRAYLEDIPVKGSLGGLAILVLSLATYWFGFKAETHYIGYAAIQFFIAGTIIWFLGWRFFNALFFPWLFLVFTWPLVFLDGWLALPLRLIMTNVSFHFLNLIGLETVRIGTAIVSAPDFANNIPQGTLFQVDIADPCSGIRSLFALMMISALYGYVTMPRAWQHIVIFIAALPLAVAGNFVRILMLTGGTLAFGSEFAIGSEEDPTTYHMAAGFVVFGVAIGGMLLLGSWLKKIAPGPPSPWDAALESETKA